MIKPFLTLCAVAVALAGWVAGNPEGQFGFSTDQFVTYNRIPVPIADLQVRSDGTMRAIGKSHQIPVQQLAWLAQPQPEVVIIASGWSGDAHAAGWVTELARTQVLTMPTGEALQRFNELRAQGVRVAIHVHSGC